MKEALERVIADLETKMGHCEIVLEDDHFDYETRTKLRVLEDVTNKLKEVLINEKP